MTLFLTDQITTPLGDMIIVTDAQGALRALEWTDLRARMDRLLARQYKGDGVELKAGTAPELIRGALERYFGGHLDALKDLPVAMGGTPFQRQVWSALTMIPVRETRSYGEIAVAINNPKAVRAIGLANGANPIGIVIPCHRVIGANGTMTGYGGGLERKLWLLRHEGAIHGNRLNTASA